jgi:hypothetical protein
MSPRPLFVAAAVSYAANCALGAAVATRLIDTHRIRWVHHAVYITTSVLAGSAASSLVWHRGDNTAALALLPAAVPLAAIPQVSARTRGHVLLALTAAPFFAAGLILSRR